MSDINTPWKAVEEDDAMWVLDSEGYYVFEQPSPKEAYMAAAAPDLVEACDPDILIMAADSMEEDYPEFSGRLRDRAKAQRKAIAKAEGE